MSSVPSTNSGSAAYTAANQTSMNDVRLHLCPRCKHNYDINLRNNCFVGRVPLVLQCNHTMCEECIRTASSSCEIQCPDCQKMSFVQENERRRMQDIFPVNFYLLGLLYYSKPNMSETFSINLKPSGFNYKDKDRLEFGSSSSLFSIPGDIRNRSRSLEDLNKEKCSQSHCNRVAVLRCTDCIEVYCECCCSTIHKAARGLQVHKITSIAEDADLEITEKCPLHADCILEFYCKTCDQMSCAYCTLQRHNSHSYHQLTALNSTDQPDFEELVQKTEEKFKQLLYSHKQVKTAIARWQDCNQSSHIEVAIAKYFSYAHAKLQLTEKNLQGEAVKARNYNLIALQDINSEIIYTLRNLNHVISRAKQLINPKSSSIKFNVKVLGEQLKDNLQIPCYFIGTGCDEDSIKFVCNDIFDNIEKQFSININSDKDRYRLVGENQVPADYDVKLPSEVAGLDISELNLSFSSKQELHSSSSSTGDVLCSEVLHKASSAKEDDMRNVNSVEAWMHQTTADSTTNNSLFSVNDREEVKVTHIDSPDCFFVQLNRFNRKLENLAAEIKHYVRNFAPYVKTPELNKLYIVKYEVQAESSEWYRGRIIDISCNQQGQKIYTILFIDYGNTAVVNGSMLREINKKLVKLEPLAVQCKLFNTFPKHQEWDARTTKYMAQILTGKVLMVVMSNVGNHFEVDLIICSSYACSLREALIYIGYASSYLDEASALPYSKVMSEMPKLYTKAQNYRKGQTMRVVLTYVVDPHNIYVQEVDCLRHIDDLHKSMASHYKSSLKGHGKTVVTADKIYVPQIDMIVAVHIKHNNNSKWYRGIVRKVFDGVGMVEVHLVDYGKNVTISHKELRKLCKNFQSLDCQAILMKMADIIPAHDQKSWSQESISFIIRYIQKRYKLRLDVVETGKPCEVALFECHSTADICINALMVQKELAKSSGKMSENTEWLKNKSAFEEHTSYICNLMDTIQSSKVANADTDESESDDKENKNQMRIAVEVLLTEDPGKIYVVCKDEKTKKQQHDLHQFLQDRYSIYHEHNVTWQVNDTCVVFHTSKKEYFRAVILKQVDDLNYKVMLRDIAEEFLVSKGNIYVLENRFKQYSEGAIRCHLSGIIPAGDKGTWSSMSTEYLREIFKNNDILMTRDGSVDKIRKSLPVIMWYTKYKSGDALEPSKLVLCNVNKLLVNNGLAFKQRPNTNDINASSSMDVETTRKQTELPVLSEQKSANKTSEASEEDIIADDIHSLRLEETIQSHEVAKIDEETSLFKENEATYSMNLAVETSVDNKGAVCYTEKGVTDWIELIEEEENEKSHATTSIAPEIIQNVQITDWLPPRSFSGHSFYAVATFVDYEACIYLHESELEPALHAMEEKMKVIFDNFPAESPHTVWLPGQLCTVKYHMNDNWYRGKIIGVNDKMIKVRMIDYGNEEDCEHEELRRNVMYIDIPAFANKIQLYDVCSKECFKWLTSDLDELHRKVVEAKIYVQVKEDTQQLYIATPAIVYANNVNINEYMLAHSTNLVRYNPKQKYSDNVSDTESDDVIIEEIYSDNLLMYKNELLYKSDELDSDNLEEDIQFKFSHSHLTEKLIGQNIPISIVSIHSYNEFIFEVLSDLKILETKDLFDKISQSIKDEALLQPVVHNPTIGLACISKFSEDGEWYRGEIVSIDDDDCIGIWFVDFGNFENVLKENIRAIKRSWLELPVVQYKGELQGVTLPDEGYLPDVLKHMANFCGVIKIANVLSVNPIIVQLFDNNQKLLYQDLIDHGLLLINSESKTKV